MEPQNWLWGYMSNRSDKENQKVIYIDRVHYYKPSF